MPLFSFTLGIIDPLLVHPFQSLSQPDNTIIMLFSIVLTTKFICNFSAFNFIILDLTDVYQLQTASIH